jgi:hypothetical protein
MTPERYDHLNSSGTSHRTHAALTGMRVALNIILFNPHNPLSWSDASYISEAGGVLDHMQKCIDILEKDQLTPEELQEGWHFCPAFDGLLTQGEALNSKDLAQNACCCQNVINQHN